MEIKTPDLGRAGGPAPFLLGDGKNIGPYWFPPTATTTTTTTTHPRHPHPRCGKKFPARGAIKLEKTHV